MRIDPDTAVGSAARFVSVNRRPFVRSPPQLSVLGWVHPSHRLHKQLGRSANTGLEISKLRATTLIDRRYPDAENSGRQLLMSTAVFQTLTGSVRRDNDRQHDR